MESKKYDVVVVGGGFAGAAAAIAAAREGKRVRLIERYNCLGGAACYNLVSPFMKYWAWLDEERTQKKVLSRGIFAEVVDGLSKMGGLGGNNNVYFNEECLKLVLNRMASEAGVELLYQTAVVGVTKSGNRIEAVTVSNVSGKYDIFGDCFVDATGDANLACMAGFPYRVGRESDGLCQAMTLDFRVGGVDTELYRKTRDEIDRLYKKSREEGKITNPREDILAFVHLADGVMHFNNTRVIKMVPTNIEDVTKAEIMAREQVFETVDFLRENFEAFKNCTLLSTGMQIGVRESRMIVGEYTLTRDDLLALTKFDDGIAACCYAMDIHSPDGSGTHLHSFPTGTYYTIPYRSLVPRNSENLIVAGRCISAEHEAQASVRIMPTVCTMGEAAGVAASVVLNDKTTFGDVDAQKVRAILRGKGAVID